MTAHGQHVPARILVAHAVPRRRTGGMSRIMGELHDRLDPSRYSVDYLCSDDVAPIARGRLARICFPLAVCLHARKAARLGRPYDLINVHEPSAAALVTWRAACGDPIVVVTTHGVEQRAWALALAERALGRAGPSFKTRLVYPLTSLWQSSRALRRADHVLCLSTEDQRYLQDRFGIPPNHTTRIGPGASAEFAAVSRDRDYSRSTRLIFAGTWRRNKGIEDLVVAFSHLAAHDTNLTLTVLGPGTSDEAVTSSFPARLRPRVTCIHPESDGAIAAALADAHVFILPSLFEGTPLTLVEAMAAGLPIVTTATCGMLDVLEDERTGLLVQIRSPDQIVRAVSRLIESAALRAALGRAARDTATRDLTWPRAASVVAGVYEHLLAARGSRPTYAMTMATP